MAEKLLILYDLEKNIYTIDGIEKINRRNYFFFQSESLLRYESKKSIYNNFISSKKRFLNSYEGEFLLVNIDFDSNLIEVAIDKFGKTSCFYFKNNKFLIISNDYFEICRLLIEHNVNIKFNFDFIKQVTYHNVSLDGRTIVKDINMVPASSLLVIKRLDVCIQKYWSFHFVPDYNLEIDSVTDKTYSIFDRYMADVSELFSEKKFGIGLSGGLDSRIIGSLARKNNIKLVPYCIGKKRVYKIFNSYGYRLSKKISKKLSIKTPYFIEYDSEPISDKIANDLYYYSWKSSNIEISNLTNLPSYDFLLNGEHGGVFFGEFDFRELAKYNKNNIDEYLLKFLSFNKGEQYLLNEDDKKETHSVVKSFVNAQNSDDIFEIFFSFFFQIYGSKSKNGFFESNYGTKRRFTPFLSPQFIQFFLTWPNHLRFSRVVQYRLLEKYFPELNSIKDESLDAAPKYRTDSPVNWLRRFLGALEIKIFKSSVNIKNWILRNKIFYLSYSKIVDRQEDFINKNFPNFNKKSFFYSNPRAAINFTKLLYLVDVINNRKFTKDHILAHIKKIIK